MHGGYPQGVMHGAYQVTIYYYPWCEHDEFKIIDVNVYTRAKQEIFITLGSSRVSTT